MAGCPASEPAFSRRHMAFGGPLGAVAAILDAGLGVPDPDLALPALLSGAWSPALGGAAPQAARPATPLDGARGSPAAVRVPCQETPRIEARRIPDCVQPPLAQLRLQRTVRAKVPGHHVVPVGGRPRPVARRSPIGGVRLVEHVRSAFHAEQGPTRPA